jgi:hypothetical protein
MIVRSRARWPVSQWLLPMMTRMTMMMTWAITAAHAQAPTSTPTPAPAPAPMPQPAWPDDFLTRVEMNAQLDNSDTPFGKVVRELNFRRHTLSSTLLWWPLPANWEMGAALPAMGERSLSVPTAVLEQRAVLTLPDGTPFSAVVETYSGNLFAFGPLSVGNTSKPH